MDSIRKRIRALERKLKPSDDDVLIIHIVFPPDENGHQEIAATFTWDYRTDPPTLTKEWHGDHGPWS